LFFATAQKKDASSFARKLPKNNDNGKNAMKEHCRYAKEHLPLSCSLQTLCKEHDTGKCFCKEFAKSMITANALSHNGN